MPARRRVNPDPIFPPRVRFNWGFWDARNERSMNRTRRLVDRGPQSFKTVSRTRDRFYHAGYAAGLDSRPADDVRTSEPAWQAWRQRQQQTVSETL